MTLGASRLVRAVLLGALLGLHFYTRLHAQQVTPLQERHIYPFSYLVSLSLNEGGGFGYLLPASVTPEHAWAQPVPRPGDPFFPILSFFRLAGPESITDAELAAYRRSGLYVAPAIPFESTRVLDIRVTSWLWRIFGVDWRPYFAFYALVSTLVAFAIFAIVVWATDSSWIGLAAIAGFTVSPLELYAGAWSTRDSVPLWFTALPFGVLAGFGALARGARSTLAGAFVLGASSLVGLGWRPDFQLVPPLVLAGLVATLASQRRSLRQVAQAVAAFATGCAVVVVVLLALGSGSYSQGSVVFHIAWYGESDRSNLFQTENAFQVARSDGLTLFQANYFAAARFGAGPGGSPAGAPYDSRHHRRCREMYLELARYQAAAWWNAFPRFLARAAALDRPTLLGSGVEASAFLDRRPGWFKTIGDGPFGRYGRLLPGLMLIGVVGGLLDRRARLTTALMAGYYVVYSAILLAVLPEAKHAIPLLLPVHVIGAIGVWSLARAARELPQLVRSARHALRPMAVAVVVLAVGWSALGAVLHPVSAQQRRRILEAVREVARAPSRVPQEPGVKLFSVSPPGDAFRRPYWLPDAIEDHPPGQPAPGPRSGNVVRRRLPCLLHAPSDRTGRRSDVLLQRRARAGDRRCPTVHGARSTGRAGAFRIRREGRSHRVAARSSIERDVRRGRSGEGEHLRGSSGDRAVGISLRRD